MKRKLLGLVLACSLAIAGCAWFRGSFWPQAEHCAPSTASLVAEVGDILAAGGDYESALEQAALQYGKIEIACAVQAFVSSVGADESASALAAKTRGREFLARVKAGK